MLRQTDSDLNSLQALRGLFFIALSPNATGREEGGRREGGREGGEGVVKSRLEKAGSQYIMRRRDWA